MRLFKLFPAAMLAWLCGCGPQTAPDTRAADEEAIRAVEAEWSQAAQAKHLDHFVSFYAEDATVFPPNEPAATGKQAISSALKPLMEAPGFSLSFQPTKVEVARSGDLGYAHGTYSTTMNDPQGKPVADKGKYVVVYKKQADGSWKAVADIFNSDLPLPAPPEPAKPKKK